MADSPTTGAVLASVREKRGLSRRQLSLAAGLSESHVGKVESGVEPSFRVFSKIAHQLGLNAREIYALVQLEAGRD